MFSAKTLARASLVQKIWLIPQSVTSLLPLSHSPLNTLALEPLTGKKYSIICTNLCHSSPSIFTRYISTLFSQCKYYIAEDLRSGYLIIRWYIENVSGPTNPLAGKTTTTPANKSTQVRGESVKVQESSSLLTRLARQT